MVQFLKEPQMVVVQNVFAAMATQTSTTEGQANTSQRSRRAHDPPSSSQSQANPSTSSSRVRFRGVNLADMVTLLPPGMDMPLEGGVPLEEEVLVLAVGGGGWYKAGNESYHFTF